MEHCVDALNETDRVVEVASRTQSTSRVLTTMYEDGVGDIRRIEERP